MECSAVPDNTHVVLHGAGHQGTAMILKDGYVNPLVTLYDSLVHLSVLKRYAIGYFHTLI